MGCCLFFGNKKKTSIEINNKIPKGQEYDHLRPEGKIVHSIDTTDEVPKIEISFNGWCVNSVHLWPEYKKVRPHFLQLERTPPVSPQVFFSSESFDSGVNDTIF